MDCKVGDIVYVRGRIVDADGRFAPGNSWKVEFEHGDVTYWAYKDEIVHLERRPIAVGDTVRAWGEGWESPYYRRMEVLAVSKGKAWCLSGGYDYIIEVENLERVSDL